jgi:integrase
MDHPCRTKKGYTPKRAALARGFVVPMSRQAMALLNVLRGDGDRRDENLIFTGGRGARLSNWPRRAHLMQRRLGFYLTPHALRRTTATLAGDLGCAPHVIQALLGHRVGSALHSGYNQSRYTPEVAQALQRVADMLDALAAGNDNVITLRA